MKTASEICVEYILENEMKDFYDNPDANHIYYYALCAFYNKRVADRQLENALEDLNANK